MDTKPSRKFEFIIIGGGIAGSKAFYHFSQLGTTLLIEKQSKMNLIDTRFNAKVICAHTFPWMKEAPFQDETIFPRNHCKAMYASKFKQGIVTGKEFGAPLGKITHLAKFIDWYQQQGLTHGGEIEW